MQKIENIIVVGTGDLYSRFLAPSLKYLQDQKKVNVLLTLDINGRPPEDALDGIRHEKRKPDEKLSEILKEYREKYPIVILAHANDYHTRDTVDLINAGFRVILEKPYAANFHELRLLRELDKNNPGKIAFIDYYIFRKILPLLIVAGIVKKESFILKTEEAVRYEEIPGYMGSITGQINSLIGKPLSLSVKILEGSTDSGKLNSRGDYLCDIRKGGGMIQDLGLHAISSVFSLRNYLGDIGRSFREGKVNMARASEYMDLAKEIFNLEEKNIAESYSTIKFRTPNNIPVEIIVGKYVSDNPEQKRLTIHGSKADLVMDMYNNVLFLIDNNDKYKKLELINSKHSRYAPVILSAIQILNKNNPFKIDTNELLLDSQEFILNVLEKARKEKDIVTHRSGVEYFDIFKAEKRRIVVPNITFSTNKILSDKLKKEFPESIIVLNDDKERLTGESLINFMKDADIAIVGLEDINEQLLKGCKRLKLVAKYGVGLDNLDFEACKKHGVKIGFKKGTNRRSVAELTLSFMLELIRNTHITSNQLKEGIWNKSGGIELTGKTIGIIGVGNVGKEIISLLKPFNCKILVNDIINQKDFYAKNGLIEASKESMYKEADIITVHTPLTNKTEKMINRRVLSMMKPSAFLINTARGPIINESDLLWALKEKKIAGAAIDVYNEEPPKNRELIGLPNLICTPHIAGNSREAVLAMGEAAIASIKEFIEDESQKRI